MVLKPINAITTNAINFLILLDCFWINLSLKKRDLVCVCTVIKKNNNLRIPKLSRADLCETNSEAEMMRVDAVDFSQKLWIGKHLIAKYWNALLKVNYIRVLVE